MNWGCFTQLGNFGREKDRKKRERKKWQSQRMKSSRTGVFEKCTKLNAYEILWAYSWDIFAHVLIKCLQTAAHLSAHGHEHVRDIRSDCTRPSLELRPLHFVVMAAKRTKTLPITTAQGLGLHWTQLYEVIN